MNDLESTQESIHFYQGGEKVANEGCVIQKIKQKVAELCNLKNVHFLLGAGTSSGAIPSMKVMQEDISKEIEATKNTELKELYNSIKSDNLEKTLNILYAKKYFLEGCVGTGASKEVKEVGGEGDIVDALIKHIQDAMFSKINTDFSGGSAASTLELYKRFYQKIVLRNKDLARANIFTTNNDLFNENALDNLNINYNNGFGGGHERVFNPARFRYTLSKKIDANLEKFEPIDNMVYLYKLHGSISWIEKEGNSLFNVQEVSVTGGSPKEDSNHVLIYPTPFKQTQSLGSPYSDLIREFQTKLALKNSVLFIIGYSFSDEHLNNIIYQTLASNSSISIVIFGEYDKTPLSLINDSRIYRVFGENSAKEKGYDLALMSDLPNGDKDQAEQGIIYLSQEGDYNYVVRDLAGEVKEGKIDGVNLSQLEQKIKEKEFKTSILGAISKAGHTQEKVHYFKYIVDSILPLSDENKDKSLMDNFVKAFKKVTTNGGIQ